MSEPLDAVQMAYAMLITGVPLEECAARYDVTVSAIQAECGDSPSGHDFQWADRGDGLWYQSQGPCCAVCGAQPVEDEG